MAQSASTEQDSTPTDDAAVVDRLESLFSASEPEDTADSETAEKPATATQSDEEEEADTEPADASEDDSDSQDDEEGDDEDARPATVKVKVDGKEVEITLDEALKGYSRTAHFTQQSQALAAERKTFEAQAAGVRERAVRYDQGLAQIEAALTNLMPKEPDWDTLYQQHPADQVNRARMNYQTQKEQLDAVKGERARVAQEAFEEHKAAQSKVVAAERTKLQEIFPELKDEAKAPVFQRELTQFALSKGFTVDELNNTVDHRNIVLLHDAMQYHKLVAKQKAVSEKVGEKIKTAPPGVGSRGKPAKKSDVERAEARLANSGSDEDAVELLLARAGRKK